MSLPGNKKPSVEDLRREIDAIDREIQTLIERRADVVVAIGKAKKSGGALLASSAMRPGREAEIIRQVVARHKGALPVGVLIGLWRGIISAFLRLQYPFTVFVATGQSSSAEAGFALWDQARLHFGPSTPLIPSTNAADVVARVARDNHALGVIALADGSDWWLHLAPAAPGAPQVVARLPFAEVDTDQPPAFVIATADREPTGKDVTLLRLLGVTDALADEMAKALGAKIIASHGKAGHRADLLAAPGYLAKNSNELAPFRGLWAGLDIIGGYAAPIRLKDDAQS